MDELSPALLDFLTRPSVRSVVKPQLQSGIAQQLSNRVRAQLAWQGALPRSAAYSASVGDTRPAARYSSYTTDNEENPALQAHILEKKRAFAYERAEVRAADELRFRPVAVNRAFALNSRAEAAEARRLRSVVASKVFSPPPWVDATSSVAAPFGVQPPVALELVDFESGSAASSAGQAPALPSWRGGLEVRRAASEYLAPRFEERALSHAQAGPSLDAPDADALRRLTYVVRRLTARLATAPPVLPSAVRRDLPPASAKWPPDAATLDSATSTSADLAVERRGQALDSNTAAAHADDVRTGLLKRMRLQRRLSHSRLQPEAARAAPVLATTANAPAPVPVAESSAVSDDAFFADGGEGSVASDVPASNRSSIGSVVDEGEGRLALAPSSLFDAAGARDGVELNADVASSFVSSLLRALVERQARGEMRDVVHALPQALLEDVQLAAGGGTQQRVVDRLLFDAVNEVLAHRPCSTPLSRAIALNQMTRLDMPDRFDSLCGLLSRKLGQWMACSEPDDEPARLARQQLCDLEADEVAWENAVQKAVELMS